MFSQIEHLKLRNMNVQITLTTSQSISSNTKIVSFFNVEDIIFQLSVLDAGIKYTQGLLYNTRNNKDYNRIDRQLTKYCAVHGALQFNEVYQDHIKNQSDPYLEAITQCVESKDLTMSQAFAFIRKNESRRVGDFSSHLGNRE